jgi:hypothetical protein
MTQWVDRWWDQVMVFIIEQFINNLSQYALLGSAQYQPLRLYSYYNSTPAGCVNLFLGPKQHW